MAHQPAADPALASLVKNGGPRDGLAHVYVYLGDFNGLVMTMSNGSPADLLINGLNIGGINKHECMYVPLSPGLYSFSWAERVSTSPVRSQQSTFDLRGNSNSYLALNIDQHTGAVFGLLGAAMDPPTGSIEMRPDGGAEITDMKIVLPTNTAMALLRPMGAVEPSSAEAAAPVVGDADIQPAPVRQPSIPQNSRVSPPRPNGDGTPNPMQVLQEVKALYERSLITKEEYDSKRKELLDAIK